MIASIRYAHLFAVPSINSPFGQSLRPLIDSFFKPVSSLSLPSQLATMNGISVASSKKDLIETPLTQSDSSSEGDASQASSSSPINLPHVEDVKRGLFQYCSLARMLNARR